MRAAAGHVEELGVWAVDEQPLSVGDTLAPFDSSGVAPLPVVGFGEGDVEGPPVEEDDEEEDDDDDDDAPPSGVDGAGQVEAVWAELAMPVSAPRDAVASSVFAAASSLSIARKKAVA